MDYPISIFIVLKIVPANFIKTNDYIIDGNEIKITNAIIDSELRQGNTRARDLINKSFSDLS